MRLTFSIVVVLSALLMACGDDGRPPTPDTGIGDGGGDTGGGDTGGGDTGGGDTGPMDSGVDTGPTDSGADTSVPMVERNIKFQSSGGGESSSTSYRLQLSVGAPQPTGAASGSANEIITGPAAARP